MPTKMGTVEARDGGRGLYSDEPQRLTNKIAE
jgi:hypothetical protein